MLHVSLHVFVLFSHRVNVGPVGIAYFLVPSVVLNGHFRFVSRYELRGPFMGLCFLLVDGIVFS